MALSTGRCPEWPIWQGELGQGTEDSQIIHKHNGHQYWKDDRWDCRQRPGFNFYSFFSCRRPYRFSQSHLSAIRPMRRSQAPTKSEPRAVVLVTQMTKWIRHGAIMTVIWIMILSKCLVGIGRETQNTLHVLPWPTLNPSSDILRGWKWGQKVLFIYIPLEKRHQVLTVGVR